MKNRKQTSLLRRGYGGRHSSRKQTSPRIAELAAKTLGDERASKKSKALAGSALAQSAVAKRKAAAARKQNAA